MCLFVTMTVSKDANLLAVIDVLGAHDRIFLPLDGTERVSAVRLDEVYFLAQGSSCDCDTWLGEARRDTDRAVGWTKRHENRRKAMEKKGWSKAKIERAVADMEGAHRDKIALRQSRTAGGKNAEIAKWSSIVRSVPQASGANYVGLLLHQYSGAIEDEEIVARREMCSQDSLEDFLLSIEEDVLYEFKAPKERRGKEKAG